ncbi:hypothetical protein ACIQFP_10420 [Nocardiopsis alba]|uniref:hypothetical protein n=1 Tax=Nocardiopsis alba TaxID=53437 RepID=UPI0038074C23
MYREATMTRRIADCRHRYRHTHVGELRGEDIREGDAVCIDGEVGRVVADPWIVDGLWVVPLDSHESPRVAPDDVVARVDAQTLVVLDWDDEDGS